jgi:transcriptional regulator GlxA family with amidase domain
MVKIVGFLLFPGFEVLDVYGPLSFFASPRLSGAYQVLIIAQSTGPVEASNGVSTVATHDFTTAPSLDILVVPGMTPTCRNFTPHVTGFKDHKANRHAFHLGHLDAACYVRRRPILVKGHGPTMWSFHGQVALARGRRWRMAR